MRISDWSSDVCSSDLANCRGSGSRRFHSDGAQARFRRFARQTYEESLHGGPMASRLPQQEVVMFRSDRMEPELIEARDSISEERLVGTERVRTCRSRWSLYHTKQTNKKIHNKY